MLHHVSFGVASLERSAAFYDAALGALGFTRVWSVPDAVGYGSPGGGDKLAIKAQAGPVAAPSARFHLAFRAPSRGDVDGFYAAALAQGGQDNGAPGLRAAYGPDYYAAFVSDPDGYRIEAVFKGPA